MSRFDRSQMPRIGPIVRPPTDRFGVPLRAGSYVVFRPAEDLVFQVVGVEPILDPRAPTGTVKLTLQTNVPIAVQAGQRVAGMISIAGPQSGEVAPDESVNGSEPSGGSDDPVPE